MIDVYRARQEQYLKQLLQTVNIPAKRIQEATEYSVLEGGKRLRPLFVYLAGVMLNVPIDALDVMAAAIELTHCYSLIHDDLPAMDDDDFRRGKPSCHKAFDEATAILVGDGLQALAIELLLDKLPLTMSAQKTVVITKELVSANGFMGMISGQSLDLSELKNPNLSLDMLSFIHNLKTGKLIVACFNMAILASSDVGHIESEALKKFAYEIGLVFQMQDDYLDHYAPQSVLGKGASSDLLNEKVTFASLFSKDTLAEKINALYRDAIENLKPFGEQANDLIALTETLRLRSNGISE